jgi:hypothetical protein
MGAHQATGHSVTVDFEEITIGEYATNRIFNGLPCT